MKQTAVEWIADNVLSYKHPTNINGTDYILIPINKVEYLKEQAKEMEKEQMRLADKNGQDRSQYKQDCEYGGAEYWDSEPKPFDEFYNETFEIKAK